MIDIKMTSGMHYKQSSTPRSSKAYQMLATTSTLLAASLLLPLKANAIQLTNGQGFNAIIFGDLYATGGDTEGRLAVGGNLMLPNTYSVGDCSSGPLICGDSRNVLPRSTDGSRIDLVVGGNITGNAQWGMNSGSASIGGSITGVQITTAPGSPNRIIQGLGANIPFDFNTARTNLISDSGIFSNLSATAGTSVKRTPWNLTLKGTDPGLNVFNIDAATWTGIFDRYIDVPTGSQVLINVSGEAVNISGGQIYFGIEDCVLSSSCLNPINPASNTLVNYYQAKTINLATFEHQGSMLAPLAALVSSGGGINGQTVVASANTSNGFEFHYRNEGGSVLVPPQPPTEPPQPPTEPPQPPTEPPQPPTEPPQPPTEPPQPPTEPPQPPTEPPIDRASVPEPTTVLGLLAFGLMQLSSLRKNKKA